MGTCWCFTRQIRDGALSDARLNEFQVRCFLVLLFNLLKLWVSKGCAREDARWEKGRLETTWTVLRKFGYDNELKLRDDLLPTTLKRAPDQLIDVAKDKHGDLIVAFGDYTMCGDHNAGIVLWVALIFVFLMVFKSIRLEQD
ncbi:hypothetical protein HPP92_018410 [Vanilla planifolia]|uniref:EF hand associated type-2 domain-containing protein n=1 Tax=Vanilla planifolia TaxID=51239 RepID=A0A835Q9R4_VANPL|nr:hypothetical protein HPP92_018410 [Vanilla planifolia]